MFSTTSVIDLAGGTTAMPDPQRLIRVVVADDHPAVRAGLRALLEAEPDLEPVGDAADAYEVPALIHRVRPDVIVLDYQLPGSDGITLCRELKRSPTAPAVVLYSAFVGPHMHVPARIAGVDAIVDKATPPRDLAMILRRIAAGESLAPAIEPDMLAIAGERLAPEDLPILAMLAHGSSHVEIADAMNLSPEELDGRIGRALGRLTVDRAEQV